MTIKSTDLPEKGKSATEVLKGEAKKIESPKMLRKNKDDDRVIMKMLSENASYTTESGVRFTKEHPFQLVDPDEANRLLKTRQFMYADEKEVKDFYGK